MENNELNLDQLLDSEDDWNTPPEAPAEEIKQIRGSLRRRSAFTIAISVALAAVLLVVTVWCVIPFVESLYWNPDDTTYKNNSDLQTTIHAYTELFQPGYALYDISHQKTGFASWSLEIPLCDSATWGEKICSGTLEKNKLTLSDQFINTGGGYMFALSREAEYIENYMDRERIARVTAQLQELPSYIQVEAAVSFSKDLSMEEFCEFLDRNFYYKLTWVPIRCFEPTGEWTPSCGMSPRRDGPVYEGLYADYPYFSMSRSGEEPAQLEQHFISLLKYSADRLAEGRGIVPYDDPNLYQEILDYVDKNGIYTYGCVVYGSPEALLRIMEDEDVCYISLTNAWLDVN